jgi:hypothetical protein
VEEPSPTDTLPSPVDEGARVAGAAQAAGVTLKLTGGVAVAIRCPTASKPPLAREYADIDAVGAAKHGKRITALLESLGYEADITFNALHGGSRLCFWDRTSGRQLDVFLDRVEMCHTLDLSRRLDEREATIPLADLLLMKLQVFETNRKDYLDILALLVDQSFTEDDCGINLRHITALTAHDWGLWRTVTMVAERADHFAGELDGFDQRSHVHNQVRRMLDELETSQKSRGWRLRARVGDRKRWYQLPEEVR